MHSDYGERLRAGGREITDRLRRDISKGIDTGQISCRTREAALPY